MGVAILCLAVGIPLGLFMLLRPRKIWWALLAWKYKDPEANEPSEARYAMSSLGGLVVIVCTIGVAILAWTSPSGKDTVEAQAAKQREQAADDYVVPQPQDRGQLPVIGYQTHPALDSRTLYTIWYLQPQGAFNAPFVRSPGTPGKERLGCVSLLAADPAADPLAVNVRLSWEPRAEPFRGADGECTTWRLGTVASLESQSVVRDSPATAVLTDSAIVDPNGKVLVPAASGNVVPELAAAPRR